MNEVRRLADLHAYVDDCLEPEEREAFEKLLAEDPPLARRAQQWRGQNGAIRAAFDGEGHHAFSISLIRHHGELPARTRRASPAGGRPPSETLARLSVAPMPPDAGRARLPNLRTALRFGLAGAALVVACAWSFGGAPAPATKLGEAGVAAFRAFARPDVAAVEVAAADRAEAQTWLSARLARPVYLPQTPASLRLVGARLTPAPGASAGFAVYRSDAGLVGLLAQALDAPATQPPELVTADGRNAVVWASGGQGYAVTGDLDAAALMGIARSFFDLPAPGGNQPAPERGS